MAKTSGGVRSKVLEMARGDGAVRLKNLNWNAGGPRKIADVGHSTNGGFFGVIRSASDRNRGFTGIRPETYTARTERQVLSWMKKRGFVPK